MSTEQKGPGGKTPPPGSSPGKAAPAGKPDLSQPVPNAALDALKEALEDAVEEVVYHAGQVSVRVDAGRLLEVCRFLKEDSRAGMNLLSDLCAVDYPGEEKRFELVYQLYSISHSMRLRLKVRVDENTPVPTVTGIWPTANWHEREAFDLFGMRFEGHPDLTRILLPDDWKGHPLRKEYPLEGFAEQHPRFR